MLVVPDYYQPRKGVLLLPEETRIAPQTKGGEGKNPLFPMLSDSVGQSLAGHRKATYPDR